MAGANPATGQRTYFYVKAGQTLKGYPEGSCFKAERKSKNKKYSIALTYPFAAQAAYAADIFNGHPLVVASDGLARANFLGQDDATEALAMEMQHNSHCVCISDIEELRVRARNELTEVSRDITSRINKKHAILKAREDPAGSADASTAQLIQDQSAKSCPGVQKPAADKQSVASTSQKLLQTTQKASSASGPLHAVKAVGTADVKPLGLFDNVKANRQGASNVNKSLPGDMQAPVESRSIQDTHGGKLLPTLKTSLQVDTSAVPKSIGSASAGKICPDSSFQLFKCGQRTAAPSLILKQDHDSSTEPSTQPAIMESVPSEPETALKPTSSLLTQSTAELLRASSCGGDQHDMHMLGDSEDQGWSPRYQAAEQSEEFHMQQVEDINNHAVSSDRVARPDDELARDKHSLLPSSATAPAMEVASCWHQEGKVSHVTSDTDQSPQQATHGVQHVSACADALARAQSASLRSRRDVIERIESSLQKEYGKKWPPPMLTQQWDRVRASVLSQVKDIPIQIIHEPSPELLSLLYMPRRFLRGLWVLQCFHLRAHQAQQAAFARMRNNMLDSDDVQHSITTAMNIQPARGCMLLLRHSHGVTCRRVLRMYERTGSEFPNWYGFDETLPQALIELEGHVIIPLDERILDCDLTDIPRSFIAQSIAEYKRSGLFKPMEFSSIVPTVQVLRAYTNSLPHALTALKNIQRMTQQTSRESNLQLKNTADSYKHINSVHQVLTADLDLLNEVHIRLFNRSLQDHLKGAVPPSDGATVEQQSKYPSEQGALARHERVRDDGQAHMSGSKRVHEHMIDRPSKKSHREVSRIDAAKHSCPKRFKAPASGIPSPTWPSDWQPEQDTGVHDLNGNKLKWGQLRAHLLKRTCLNCFKRGHRRQDCWAPQKPVIDFGVFASAQ